MEEIFRNYNDDNTSTFNFSGNNCYARVVNITDGDTIKVIINYFNKFYKITPTKEKNETRLFIF